MNLSSKTADNTVTIHLELSVPLQDKDYKKVVVPYKSDVLLTADYQGLSMSKHKQLEIFSTGLPSAKAILTLTSSLGLIKDRSRPVDLILSGPAKEVDYLKMVLKYVKYWSANDWRKKNGDTVLNKEELTKLLAVIPCNLTVL
jgi:hypothetical protein